MFNVGPATTAQEAVDKCAKDYLLSLDLKSSVMIPDRLKISVGSSDYFVPLLFWGGIEEKLRDDAYDHCGEAADLWTMAATTEQTDRLETALNYVLHGWLHEIEEWPTCCSIKNIQVFTWSEADQKWSIS